MKGVPGYRPRDLSEVPMYFGVVSGNEGSPLISLVFERWISGLSSCRKSAFTLGSITFTRETIPVYQLEANRKDLARKKGH
jgi:hypothetical protein